MLNLLFLARYQKKTIINSARKAFRVAVVKIHVNAIAKQIYSKYFLIHPLSSHKDAMKHAHTVVNGSEFPSSAPPLSPKTLFPLSNKAPINEYVK